MGCGCASGFVPKVATLAALGLFIGAGHSWMHPIYLRLANPKASPANLVSDSASSSSSSSPAKPHGSVAPQADAPLGLHVSLAQAKQLWDEGLPFIDARLAKDFALGHIAGAKDINPVNFNEPESLDAMKYMDLSKPVVIYCGGGDCHDSENTAILLQQFGFTSFHIFTDGFPAWKAAGYEVEVSSSSEGTR
mgnify:CR=1 FL=1